MHQFSIWTMEKKMKKLMSMKVGEAYVKSTTNQLANELWAYKNPNEMVDTSDREYISWINSLPRILECAHYAELDELLVIFEMKTPISNKAIDVLFLGKSEEGENRVLLVELKQWSRIATRNVYNVGKVYVPEARATRRHPIKQLKLYKDNLANHHSGIENARKNGVEIKIGITAYLHNFANPQVLCSGNYDCWQNYKDFVFGCGESEKKRLTRMLGRCFKNSYEGELLEILEEYEAILGDEGLAGLKSAYANEASLQMQLDQQVITNFVVEHLRMQKKSPQKEIIVVSGGPGTGKTIVGIRFILEYVNLFNNGHNDNKVIFSLPKSQTVKAMFDAACSVDEENENEYCCYLQEISNDQNLVVVDEAHRITELNKTLDEVFDKGTKLLILLQDNHQLLRPGEEGTFEAFKYYSNQRGIRFSPLDISEQKKLTLIDEKRCDEKLLQGITKLFYDGSIEINGKIDTVKVFNNLNDLSKWEKQMAQSSRTKYIFPFCWPWRSRNNQTQYDIAIGDFKKTWNPEDTDDQVIWLNDKKDDRAACIYTSQGLDMDNVAFIWCDDLLWNETLHTWQSNPKVLKDPAFRCEKDKSDGLWKQCSYDRAVNRNVIVKNGYALSQEEMDLLIKNTYYVMMSRPRKNLGIWFMNEDTKKHVVSVLGLVSE